MKLREILMEQLSKDEILQVLLSMDQKQEWIKFRPDGKVDLDSNVYIFDDDLSNVGTLQVPFNKIVGEISSIGSLQLRSMKNFPITVMGKVNITDADNFESLEGMPKHIYDSLTIFKCPKVTSLDGVDIKTFMGPDITLHCGITSFVGVEKHFQFKKYNPKGVGFYFDYDNITEGGLGLVLIPGLSFISPVNMASDDGPWGIINKYVGRPDDIFECQAELLDAGYEEYTKL